MKPAPDVPFVKLEDSTARAVKLAHREICRLETLEWLTEAEIRSLKVLYEVLERAKEIELKEFVLKEKYKGKP